MRLHAAKSGCGGKEEEEEADGKKVRGFACNGSNSAVVPRQTTAEFAIALLEPNRRRRREHSQLVS
jgi:hypothetical protein